MRRLTAIAVFALAFAGEASAGYSHVWFTHAHRAGMVWIVDDEPGTLIRAYWREPWRHHHYFPRTGHRPHVGRRENLSARSHPMHAKTFERGWSNEWAFENERPRLIAVPPDRRAQPVPELK